MKAQNLIRIFLWFLLFSLFFYIYAQMVIIWNNNDTGELYVIHSQSEVFYCNNIQKLQFDTIGQRCNGKYPIVEFRSPHVIIYRGE